MMTTRFILLLYTAIFCTLLVLTGCKEQAATTESTVVDPMEFIDAPQILDVLFHPRKAAKNTPPAGGVDIDIALEDTTTVGCRIYTANKEAPTIIFYHGNGEIIEDYDELAPMYLQQNLNFVLIEYRGYGWSEGSPKLSTFLPDSNQAFVSAHSWLVEQGYTGPLFIMGRSLGSACAIDVAVQHKEELAGLIIDSGFAETMPLARTLGMDLEALGVTEEMTFNNGGKIEQFDKATFILHGQVDQLIPLWQAQRLHAAGGARSKELQIIPGADHNSLILVAGQLYFEAIKKFIDKTTGAAPDWRAKRKAFKQAKQNTAS